MLANISGELQEITEAHNIYDYKVVEYGVMSSHKNVRVSSYIFEIQGIKNKDFIQLNII